MKPNILVLIFICLTIIMSCNSKQKKTGNELIESELVNIDIPPPPTLYETKKFVPPKIVEDGKDVDADDAEKEILGDKSSVDKKKIIKDGNISVKTNDINASKKAIDDLLKKLNSYYEREDLQNDDQTISYDLKIRVPANNFEIFITSLEKGNLEIVSKSIQARDVTEEFVDFETRLSNKREYLKRYKELLSKASTVKDILAIEENIRTIQEEIESKEGRLNYLTDQVTFSTLDINLFKEKEFVYKPQPQDKFSERVKKSISNGWTSVVNFTLWTISIWPYYILILVGFFVIKRVFKKYKKSNV